MVPMIMSARCEGDGYHCGPWAVGQVVGRRDMGAGCSVWAYAVKANGSTIWTGAGVCTVHEEHGFA